MKPFLFLDIDGPLNPYMALIGPVPEGYGIHLTRPEGWTATPFLPVLLHPGHGAELRNLSEAYDLVWATTWMDEANEWIGPHLGLPRLPYVAWREVFGGAQDGTYWKTRDIVAYAAGRPFAWVDDEVTDADRDWVERHHPADALLLWIDPRTGLTQKHFTALASWAEALTA
ncbi:hypothetical protein H1V43_14030 [Streptomyces sp. PSKA54]|uniref:Secreted protein n=1 Tax=Streptomyces himalayensis subsp. aureolus TaxID=2758039 RepID=A0A7W2D0R7_9ACTN|nr:HAD domain-containing protein [Streptomyces himalayensis]MBA4862492.1 hypothetical protein [Streptomyces himalayensis subsp. aureolus]